MNKEKAQSLGQNFKAKRKSRLIRYTLWALHPTTLTTFRPFSLRIAQACLSPPF
jgi:hypothetical protein